MKHDKPVALITGANQGIGLQITHDLAAHGFTVLLGSRKLERGEAAAQGIAGDARAVQLDVTDARSIAAAAERVAEELGRLDVLINNAAIWHPAGAQGVNFRDNAPLFGASSVPLDDVRAVFETNVFGALAVYQAMLPLLRKTPGARIVNVSSGAGSLTLHSDRDFPLRSHFSVLYHASKTALNAMTLAMAIELEPDGIRVNAVSPGSTRTHLNDFQGEDTVEEGAREAVRLALLEGGPTGTFTHAKLGTLPW